MPSPPTSPIRTSHKRISPHRRNSAVPPGFRAAPRPQHRPISEMSVRELQDLYEKNTKVLAEPGASSSSYIHRITAEQEQIEHELVEIRGMEAINTGLKNTRLTGENDIRLDPKPEPPRALTAKQRALANFDASVGTTAIGSLSLQEAIEIEQRAHAQDLARQQRIEEKRRQYGYPTPGEVMTRAEREARIWAFMNHKPTESDLEDEDDDEDDDDPATWFEDDQDDGRKGQDLVEPDSDEDLSNIIRVVDPGKLHYSTFYEPRDDGD
ncbi:hypothetical protein K435DRAFT_772112 [Dendrothele bispora CBS 962.96]|uniref:Uncharacterized protein n=1 Tax=Dendrothele bispora (strain CBS 962.96) TaxID=1314807 RepID=A0A4S8MZP3_DENBC|nr:hypothetical protein K435DRAFT_772112 [Dendrothele bispora CBS 962.96]